MTSRMIPAGTTLMFLAILYFILIAVQGIRRKLRLKQLIASLFLFAAGAAWIAVCLHEIFQSSVWEPDLSYHSGNFRALSAALYPIFHCHIPVCCCVGRMPPLFDQTGFLPEAAPD